MNDMCWQNNCTTSADFFITQQNRLLLPGIDTTNSILRAWWIDPLVATLGYILAISIYWNEERKRNLSSYPSDKTPRFFLWLHPKTLLSNNFSNCVVSSLQAYWMGVYLWKSVIPPPGNGVLPDGVPTDLYSLLYLMAEVVVGVIQYDFVSFFWHWGMHEISFLKGFHKKHHQNASFSSDGTSSRTKNDVFDVLRHSLIDGSVQVLINIQAQRYTPWGSVKSRLGRALHNLIVTWMLTEAHTASPVPDVFRRFGVCVGVREHRLHHMGVGGHKHHRYQQFFGYLDDIRIWYLGDDDDEHGD